MKRVVLMVCVALFPRLLAAQDIDLNALAGEDWYGLYLNGQKSGFAVETLTVQDDGSVVLREEVHFRLRMMNRKQDLSTSAERFYGPDGALQRIEAKTGQDSEGEKSRVSTFVARVEGDVLLFRSVLDGEASEQEFPKPQESLEDALKQLALVRDGAKVGDEVEYVVFEPMLPGEVDWVSRIDGIEERIFEGVATKVFCIRSVSEILKSESIAYVTEAGKKLEDTYQGMVTMRLEPKEVAQDVEYNNDVLVSNAAVLDERIADPRSRPELKLRITGPLKPDHLFNDERQFLAAQDDAFSFVGKRVSLDGFEPATLPIENEAVAEWLEPTMFVQSGHDELIAKAAEIVGDETDSFAVSSKLCMWVDRNMITMMSGRLTNALEVLHSLEGDCTEHSVLFVALARAAGLPAREVAGLIYMDTAGSSPGFYFHQWAKVWIGKWIDVDPTWGQPLADVTHIKLAEGDVLKQTQLIPVIGQVRIEVVEP